MEEKEKIKILLEKGWTYNPQTGEVFSHTGKVRKSVNSDGYTHCQIGFADKSKKNITISAHRFIYYCEKGEIKGEIDHINGIRNDNRIENLRDLTKFENQQNRTTAKGVYWHKKTKKWTTKIVKNGKTTWGGYYDTIEETQIEYKRLKSL